MGHYQVCGIGATATDSLIVAAMLFYVRSGTLSRKGEAISLLLLFGTPTVTHSWQDDGMLRLVPFVTMR
jgi:hypothetical protein